MGFHLVRYSLLGQVGRFVAADAVLYPRRSRVIVRSPRGLEIGTVLSEPALDDQTAQGDQTAQVDGQILRRMTVEDDLLEARLEKHRHTAFAACATLLAEHQVPAALVDVEHLFDGQGLFFYFLGDVPAEADRLTQRLADTYETTVEFRKFAETLAEGCGPGCGTEEAMGQGGCASCTTCAVASACATKRT
jgi:cell fate regulator YaaT (PSP1 superfamily)